MHEQPSTITTLRGQLFWIMTAIIFVVVIAANRTNQDLVLLAGVLGICITVGGILFNWRIRSSLDTALHTARFEAQRLADTEERTATLYQLATTMSSTLDHNQVLEAVQQFGRIALRDPKQNIRLTSAVFLFRDTDNLLHVATAQRLTLIDLKKTTAANEGLLRQTLLESAPTFGGNAVDDPELSYYVGFQSSQSLVAVPLKAGYETYGVLVFGAPEPNAFDPTTADLLAALGTQATVALQNAALYQNLIDEKERIVQAEENARKKLSRDLHDGPTQSISAIAMRIGAIQGIVRSGENRKAYDELSKVFELADKTTKQIRHMLFAMRPLVLESHGLVAALKELSKKMLDTYNLNVSVEAEPEADRWLEDDAQGAVFYLVEEAVNNVRKHADANHVVVRLYRDVNDAVIEVQDDGVGFDVKAVDDSYARRGSLGMVSMRERAELAGGALFIKSKPKHGTKIIVRIPLALEFQLARPTTPKLVVKGQNDTVQNGEISLKGTRFSPQISETSVDEP